ncbi:hypothetical protein MASR2M78_10890 [Treponema sp.]
MKNDRRSSTRFCIRQFVDISSNGEDFLPVTALDLSLGGLSCESSVPLDPMMPVFLLLGFENEHGEMAVDVEGYVAHSKMENGTCKAGISFTIRSPEARRAIEAYLKTIQEDNADSTES